MRCRCTYRTNYRRRFRLGDDLGGTSALFQQTAARARNGLTDGTRRRWRWSFWASQTLLDAAIHRLIPHGDSGAAAWVRGCSAVPNEASYTADTMDIIPVSPGREMRRGDTPECPEPWKRVHGTSRQ